VFYIFSCFSQYQPSNSRIMATPTTVLITGVTRGIGRTLLETYLSHPNHTVIGSVRDKTSPNSQELKTLPTAPSSSLLLIKIESSSPTDPTEAIKELQAAGINHLDIVIANAGAASAALSPLESVSVEDVTACFNTNTLGPLLLFQAVLPLLQKSKEPKFVAITSGVGSIGKLEAFGAHVAPAYGISKAGLNWLTVYVFYSDHWDGLIWGS
jgi:NAD(P)-dependent dehydrogenase (short-subunit alcohol dehydrogenase family)